MSNQKHMRYDQNDYDALLGLQHPCVSGWYSQHEL